MTAFQEIQAIVNDYFEGDNSKIIEWWKTDNPFLGGVSPAEVLELKGAERLLKIVKDWREGNMA